MGTRGYFGFYYKGTYYICYNHWGSYARGLGSTLVGEIVKAMEDGLFSSWLTTLENRINKVDTDSEEISNENSDEEAKEKRETADGPSFMDFLTLNKSMDGFATKNPQWEQFAYIINFDEEQFEFYVRRNIAMVHKLELETLKHLLATFRSCIN